MIDFRSKKSCELMNSIMASDEASEVSDFFQLKCLNASLEGFVHGTLKKSFFANTTSKFRKKTRRVLIFTLL